MNIDLLIVIICSLGAIQGLILGTILYRTKIKKHSHNQWFSILLFLLSYGIVGEILHLFELGFYDIWYFLFLDYDWFYGPLLYLIAKSATRPDFRVKQVNLIHFLPLALELFISAFVKSQTFFWDGAKDSLSLIGYWSYIIWMHYPLKPIITGTLIIFYSFKANRLLKSAGVINGYDVYTDRSKWIQKMIKVLRIFAFFFIIFVFIDWTFFSYAFHPINSPIFLGLAVITYWMGLEGFSRRKVILFKELRGFDSESVNFENLGKQLERYMKINKAFLNPDLKLKDLAEDLKVKPHTVSSCIKNEYKCNFREWINQLRFDYFIFQLKEGAATSQTLLALAHNSGFNSKASFNRVVKSLSGSTPKELMIKYSE